MHWRLLQSSLHMEITLSSRAALPPVQTSSTQDLIKRPSEDGNFALQEFSASTMSILLHSRLGVGCFTTVLGAGWGFGKTGAGTAFGTCLGSTTLGFGVGTGLALGFLHLNLSCLAIHESSDSSHVRRQIRLRAHFHLQLTSHSSAEPLEQLCLQSVTHGSSGALKGAGATGAATLSG